jgi:nucleotide-binding universal stress UspA family protein
VEINVDEMQQNAEYELEKCLEDLKANGNKSTPIETEVAMGTFTDELKTLCEKVKPYAVVMGSHGMTAAERFLFGSQTIKVMKNLEWPVVTVSPDARFSTIRNIGLACDFRYVPGTTAVEKIKTLVKDFDAKLYVINSGRWDQYNEEKVFGSSVLNKMLEPIQAEFHFTYDEHTDEAILKFAEKYNIDLLVMLPKKRGFIQKIVHESMTKKIVQQSHVPIMSLSC